MNDQILVSLMQLIAPARTLREDLDKGLTLETLDGMGEYVLSAFRTLRDRVVQLTSDEYVRSLAEQIPGEATDRQKQTVAFLAAGQLVSYLEAKTGVGGLSHSHGGDNYQMAPVFNGSKFTLSSQEDVDKLEGLFKSKAK
ncbi:hypothetical protein J31TS4_12400 [Paenibacillus sp. J31TS4]|uniref:hypothetical protein n=1 Tax=Paenibacillus sp. J31TS4 TaxID=2807195 RepID=UPI001B039212|nr:hypothetical protein [Paenibacillus sp. J31TS4]GIP37960.1 hypothetical protein J31TS4_12400 [Paenibacillus sp. J31TS4]